MKWLRRLLWRLGPVPQNPGAVMLGEYEGALVRLRPDIDSDGVITKWVPDPDEVDLLRSARARALAESQPPTIPTQTPNPQNAPGDATAQGGFNPAGVAGL